MKTRSVDEYIGKHILSAVGSQVEMMWFTHTFRSLMLIRKCALNHHGFHQEDQDGEDVVLVPS
jgi:hypothetical protein